MISLTDRQARILDFVRGYLAANGYPPTLREIGAHMGIRSTNGVNDHLRALERKGHIERLPLLSRGIRLVAPGLGRPPQPAPIASPTEVACPTCGALAKHWRAAGAA